MILFSDHIFCVMPEEIHISHKTRKTCTNKDEGDGGGGRDMWRTDYSRAVHVASPLVPLASTVRSPPPMQVEVAGRVSRPNWTEKDVPPNKYRERKKRHTQR